MRLFILFTFLLFTSKLFAEPPKVEDISKMLERDIEGQMYSFMAGNRMYYIGGKVNETWDHVYHESLGFSHPMFRDGRARGFGVADGPGGKGHDKFGWEFWNHILGAKGSVKVNGKFHQFPRPTKMLWRPDKVICEYKVGGANIREEKFIAENDVLTTIIYSDKDIELTFEGHSFVLPGEFPHHWGDKKGQKWHYERASVAKHNKADKAIHVLEKGSILVKPTWETPAMKGKVMYDGLNIVIQATHEMKNVQIGADKEQRKTYKYSFDVEAGDKFSMTYSMDDDYKKALRESESIIRNPQKALDAKTLTVNTWLSTGIPRFRCSDEMTVKTYYYLWALYYMYTTDIGIGYESYPHTQTAINNFMGLHLWDSWVYAAMGGWVKDKWDYGYGNVLSWKHMVPYKDKANALPDNFGQHWYSPGVFMPYVGSVDFAWDMYLKSGDKKYLKVAYEELYKPLYWDNNGPQQCFGMEINAIDVLCEMALELGHKEDIAHWKSFRKRRVDAFRNDWGTYARNYYAKATEPWKDIWQLSSLMSYEMPDEWAKAMVKEWVMNPEDGYLGPVALRIRPPKYPPNGVFRVSTISTWLGIEGMFRHDCDEEALFATMSHIRGMNRAHGFPVAPECWDPNDRPWGSLYYAWDGPITDLILRRIAGISFSNKDNSFTVQDHMPEDWTFMEVDVPVERHGRTRWVKVRYDQSLENDQLTKTIKVTGQPFHRLSIEAWQAGRFYVSSNPELSNGEGKGSQRKQFINKRDGEITLITGVRNEKRKTYAVVHPSIKRSFNEPFDVKVENIVPNTSLRYTFGDILPTVNSKKVDGPITITKSGKLNLLAVGKKGEEYKVMDPVIFKQLPLMKAKRVKAKAGVKYEIFKGKWSRIPDLSSETAIKKGVTKNLDVNTLPAPKDRFAVRFTGFIKVPKDGVYNFHLKSDDGCRVFINKEMVLDLNILCDRDPWTATGSAGLKAGYHELEVIYFQDLHRKTLQLSYDIEERNYKAVSDNQFAH